MRDVDAQASSTRACATRSTWSGRRSESPEEFFGTPDEHAADAAPDAALGRAAATLRPSRSRRRGAVVASSLEAVRLDRLHHVRPGAVVGRDLPVGFFALPPVIGFATIGALAFWDAGLARVGHAPRRDGDRPRQRWASLRRPSSSCEADLGTVDSARSTPWLLLLGSGGARSAGTAVLILRHGQDVRRCQDDPDRRAVACAGARASFAGRGRSPTPGCARSCRRGARPRRRVRTDAGGGVRPAGLVRRDVGVDVRRRTSLKIAFVRRPRRSQPPADASDGFAWATAACGALRRLAARGRSTGSTTGPGPAARSRASPPGPARRPRRTRPVLVGVGVDVVGGDRVADGGVAPGLGVERPLPVLVADPLTRGGEGRLLRVLGVGVRVGGVVAAHASTVRRRRRRRPARRGVTAPAADAQTLVRPTRRAHAGGHTSRRPMPARLPPPAVAPARPQ